jgi:hypothetical protein
VASMKDPTDQPAAVNEGRRYVLADLTKTIGADGKISETSLARWLNGPSGWGDALSQFPAVRTEAEKLLADLRAGNAQRNALSNEVERAAQALKRTQHDVDNSALSLTLGREPAKAARAVLESGDPERAMREVADALRGDASAARAWKRAVSDHLIDRISAVHPGSDTGVGLDYARLTKAFKQHEKALAEVFSPDEMQAIQRARKLLEPLAQRSGPAATRAAAAGDNELFWRTLRLGLYGYYGSHLKAGGVAARIKDALKMFGDTTDAAQVNRLVTRMMFDPDLAAHLLTRKVAEVGGPSWNEKLAKLLRRAAVGREVLGQEEE